MDSEEDSRPDVKVGTKKTRISGLIKRTACNALTLFIIGMNISMRGPAFIDIQLISGTDVEQGSVYFTGSAFGYMIGSLIAGSLYSRVRLKTMLIVVPMVISAILFAITPWCTSFVPMLIVHILVALFMAFCETTVNTEEMHAWEGNSAAAMQFLSFAYSLGGIVGPLIVEPFLAPKVDETDVSSNMSKEYDTASGNNISSRHVNYTDQVTDTDVLPNGTVGHILGTIYSLSNESLSNTSVENVSDYYMDFDHFLNSSYDEDVDSQMELESNIHYAFLIGGILSILVMVPYCVLYCRLGKNQKQIANRDLSDETSDRKLPLKVYIFLTAVVSMLYFFYTTVDDPFCMYLSMFVVSYLDWSKENGALVSSLYWGCSTVTKLVMVILVRQINPSIVLFLSTLGMTLSMVLLTICAHFHIHIMIWVSSAMLALSQSAVFGGGIAWADANLLKCDGRVTSSIMIFASLGAMLDPMFLGVTMKKLSPMAFPYLLMFQSFFTFIIYFCMLVIIKPIVHRKYGPPRPSVTVSLDASVEGKNDDSQEEDEFKVAYSNGSGIKNITNGSSIEEDEDEEDESLMP